MVGSWWCSRCSVSVYSFCVIHGCGVSMPMSSMMSSSAVCAVSHACSGLDALVFLLNVACVCCMRFGRLCQMICGYLVRFVFGLVLQVFSRCWYQCFVSAAARCVLPVPTAPWM